MMRATLLPLCRMAPALIVFQLGFLRVARSQSVTSTSPEQVSVRAENEQLGDLLREIQTVVGIEKLIIDPGVEQRPVSITLENEPVDKAIMEILDAAKVGGVVWGGNGQPYRVFAGSGEPTKIPEPNQPPPPDQPRAMSDEAPAQLSPRKERTNPRAPVPPRGQQRPRGAPGAPVRPEDPGFGRPRTATGDASLLVPATAPRLAGVGAILGLGFLLGQLLVVRKH